MPRPKKEDTDKRSRNVNVALTEVEYSYLQRQAGHGERVERPDSKKPMPTRQRSIAGIIRQLLFSDPQPGYSVPDADERKALFQLAGMARNLNQLAAQANAQGYAAVATRTDELSSQLRQLISRYDR